MADNGYLLMVYGVYMAASIGLTVWLAQTLFRNGAVFLEDVFEGQAGLAVALNRLLVTGFYMASLGYAFLILRAETPTNAVGAVEELVTKLGLLLVSLAVIHFANLIVFHRLRGRARAAAHRPVAPPTQPVATAPTGHEQTPPWTEPR